MLHNSLATAEPPVSVWTSRYHAAKLKSPAIIKGITNNYTIDAPKEYARYSYSYLSLRIFINDV